MEDICNRKNSEIIQDNIKEQNQEFWRLKRSWNPTKVSLLTAHNKSLKLVQLSDAWGRAEFNRRNRASVSKNSPGSKEKQSHSTHKITATYNLLQWNAPSIIRQFMPYLAPNHDPDKPL